MKLEKNYIIFFIIIWFFLMVSLYILVTVPNREPFTILLPELFWNIRNFVYPFFFSPSSITLQ